MIGRTLNILADPKGEVERMAEKYGLVYRTRVLGETGLSLLGPEANEFVLSDQARLFSSTHGWGVLLGRLFPRGLLLLDFDEHRLHRRTLSVAFKAEAMKPASRPRSRAGATSRDRCCSIRLRSS